MKFCIRCGEEICTKDGENRCSACENGDKAKLKKADAARQRRERHQALLDCGLVRVRGAMGGVYYE